MNDQDTKKPKIIMICGATGIGKTTTAISLATEFNGEIISADSMQIYRHMDIGTAKPTPAEMARVPHHMIDIIDPDTPFDAAEYGKRAHRIILSLCQRHCVPFVAGGTGFYLKALIHGLCEAIPSRPEIRERLQNEAAATGSPGLHKRLSACDPQTASRLHPNDAYRIIRALEVFEITGKPLSAHQETHRFAESAFTFLKIGLQMDRETLYKRIDQRVEAMMEAGLLAEVEGLLRREYAASLNAMQSIGYRHMADFLEGRQSLEEAVRTLKRDTRRYAKRQMTWFARDTDIHWVNPDQIDSMRQWIRVFLNEE
ncbi:MAG: tRNA (adenosine(37)-N6)-dimethylallyltransferase MiaA [Pseudomonadota bacterium]